MKKRTQKPLVSIMSVKEIYDLIMWDIEPDLVSENIKYLDVMYEGESKEDKQIRLERYKRAFEIFSERFELLMKLWKEELKKGKKEMFKIFEKEALGKEGGDISGIESSITES